MASVASRIGVFPLVVLVATQLVTGCGGNSTPTPATGAGSSRAISGRIFGGQQPISGSSIQLFATGLAGDGSAATSLLNNPVKTDSNGSFNITNDFQCPATPVNVYIVATGGNPGLNAGQSNPSIGMMAALGLCTNLTASTYVFVNEMTTVGSVYALAPFMSSYQNVGSGTSDAAALTTAFGLVNEYVNIAAGTAPGSALPTNYTFPLSKMDSLADSIASCINSPGGAAGDGSLCGTLFKDAAVSGTVPTNTIDAILNIARDPAVNVASIFNLAPASGPFQPTLAASPADWTLTLIPNLTLATASGLVGIGASQQGTVTLAQPAPAGGLAIAVSSSNPQAVTVASPIMVGAGQSSATFSYTGVAAGASLLDASATGYGDGTISVTATSAIVTIAPLPILAPGQQAPLAIKLSSPAPAVGITVALASSNSAIANISPSSVTIAAGATTPATNPTVTGGQIGSSQIIGTASGYAPGFITSTVTVAATLSPATFAVTVGSSTMVTITLSAAAPAGGITFALNLDNASVAAIPTTITVPAGVATASASLTGSGAGTSTLRATSAGIKEADAQVVTSFTTAQVIKHIVVIFDENVSFDHYFGTYPAATNPSGEPAFSALPGTPQPAGLTGSLLTANPNSLNTMNGAAAVNPFRLDRAQAATADQGHSYTAEETAYDGGAVDLFPFAVGAPDSATLGASTGAPVVAESNGLTMGYFDGNTVTALWNYAQHYALNDHSFGTTFGPSTVGAINLISGQTNGVVNDAGASGSIVSDGTALGFTLIGDPDPTGDLCSNAANSVHMTGKNIGDLLSTAQISWGFFAGGFDLTLTNANGTTGCHRSTLALTGQVTADYIPHHQPFQYYATTANPNHVRPSSTSQIGLNSDAANHQYDLHDFTDALAAGNMPAVSLLKSSAFEDGHAGYSDPLDEQASIVTLVNAIERSQFWSSTAIIIAYDDSDGWYDHMIHVINASQSADDTLTSTGLCTSPTATLANVLPGVTANSLHAQGRCGYGPRLPLVVISPWANANFVDSTVTDQTSVIRLIEDTFLSSQRIGAGSFDSLAGALTAMFNLATPIPGNLTPVILDPTTGLITGNH